MDQKQLAQIQTAYPQLAGLVGDITALAKVVRALPFEPFREPVALLELSDKGTNTIGNLDAAYLTAWCRHIAYSMRVRMISFEPGMIAEVAAGRLLAAQTLLRSHFEAAAMAALCVESLQAAKREPGWADLRSLIPKTLFGTALFTAAKKDERIRELLAVAEQRTITICSAVAALDSFTFAEHASGELAGLYALLCEACHPNHRGTMGFVDSEELDPAGELGWVITYSGQEKPESVIVQRVLEALLLSMRQGYSATELLRHTGFVDDDGEALWVGVPPHVAQFIWTQLLQRDIAPSAT